MVQIENEYGNVENSFWSEKENICCYSFQDRDRIKELNVGLKEAYQSGLAQKMENVACMWTIGRVVFRMKKKILSVMEKTIMGRWAIKGMNVQENKEGDFRSTREESGTA